MEECIQMVTAEKLLVEMLEWEHVCWHEFRYPSLPPQERGPEERRPRLGKAVGSMREAALRGWSHPQAVGVGVSAHL